MMLLLNLNGQLGTIAVAIMGVVPKNSGRKYGAIHLLLDANVRLAAYLRASHHNSRLLGVGAVVLLLDRSDDLPHSNL